MVCKHLALAMCPAVRMLPPPCGQYWEPAGTRRGRIPFFQNDCSIPLRVNLKGPHKDDALLWFVILIYENYMILFIYMMQCKQRELTYIYYFKSAQQVFLDE